MARAYSDDLRERVAAASLERTCRETAELFAVSVSSVVKWAQRLRASASAAAKPMGGARRQHLQAERDWLLRRIEEKPDITLHEVLAELAARGVKTSYGAVWRLYDRNGISFKKNRARQRAGSTRRRPTARPLEDVSGPD